jgi:hypothetical protein
LIQFLYVLKLGRLVRALDPRISQRKSLVNKVALKHSI